MRPLPPFPHHDGNDIKQQKRPVIPELKLDLDSLCDSDDDDDSAAQNENLLRTPDLGKRSKSSESLHRYCTLLIAIG
jgi:hypothetical protein